MSVKELMTSPSTPRTPNTPNTPTYSDPDVDPKFISDIAEDGVIALRLAELGTASPLQSTVIVDAATTTAGMPSSRGTSGVMMPKQTVRVERDYSRGDTCQFYPAFPLEIDGRVTPRQFSETMNKLNQLLEKMHNPKYNWIDNLVGCLTLYTSTLCVRSHYDRMIDAICEFLDNENKHIYNPTGLNFRNPQLTAFLFVSFYILYSSLVVILSEGLSTQTTQFCMTSLRTANEETFQDRFMACWSVIHELNKEGIIYS